jgi:cell wall-associated NlpC family hydrolase
VRSEGGAVLQVQDFDNGNASRSRGDRAIRRRDAIGLAMVVALGLTSSDAGRRLVDAAKKEKTKKRKKKDKGKHKQDASGSGREVVREAQKHKGERYVWGGASPKGFDCSGFTWYVYKKVTGMDITRGVEEQWRFGRSVGRGEWQAGDLVFFENTFERGLSHVGIYMSGDKFIHAENEQTGVVISSLESEYYSKHYAGARRLV